MYVSVCLHVIIIISSNSSENNGRLRNDNEISLWHISIDKTRTVNESSNFNVQHAFRLPCAYYVWIGMNWVLIVNQRDKMCLVFTVVPSTLKCENVKMWDWETIVVFKLTSDNQSRTLRFLMRSMARYKDICFQLSAKVLHNSFAHV